MASVFKKTRDKGKRGAVWYISYTDQDRKRKVVKGFKDKGLTEQLAAKLENEVLLCTSGLIDPQDKLRADQRRVPIENHLSAFEKSLGSSTSKHVRLTLGRVRRVVSAIHAKTIADLSAEKVEAAITDIRDGKNLGHRTYNHYLQSVEQFGLWLVSTRRLAANPVGGIGRLNAEVDVRHRRRALTPEEFSKLIQSARNSDELIQCYDGETRARIYLLSYYTGLRRGELASLTPSSFQLDGDQKTLTVEAACSKHRRRDVLPLHPDLVQLLLPWLPALQAEELLFPYLAKRRTWLMVKKDLERVDIEYVTKAGVADFHAAGRHTYITQLIRHGVSLPEAKELARHTDIKMTMKYTHIGLGDQARALASLPSPKAEGRVGPAVPATKQKKKVVAPGHRAGGLGGQTRSASVTSEATQRAGQKRLNPHRSKGLGNDSQVESSAVANDAKWRRRESNPRPEIAPRPLLRV
jgi:integrase